VKIQPATITQLQKASTGRWVEIEADVGSVAQQLKEIAENIGVELHLRYSEVTDVFKVVQVMPDGDEQLVTSAQEADQRLVDKVREVTSPRYDLAKEAEEAQHLKDRDFDQVQHDRIGDAAERLGHALRKDLGGVL
jgi:translation initiation factor 2 alpha subunit (eIF-2alpha)